MIDIKTIILLAYIIYTHTEARARTRCHQGFVRRTGYSATVILSLQVNINVISVDY